MKNLLLRTSAVVALIAASGAMAQDSAGTEPGEIIVTARKRTESVLKVPVVQSVVTQAQLENRQITDITTLSTRVPGLNMGAASLVIGPQVSLRGVGTSTLDAGVDQSVVLNLDGLSLSQGLAYSAGLFDLAQVEVLKGPQALFFGKNSPGGVISLRTADPGDRTEVIGRFGYEVEARQRRAELILSGRLTETLGARIAGRISDMDGFFKNGAFAAPGFGAQTPKSSRLSPTTNIILRGTAVWRPTSDFDVRLKMNYTYDDVQGEAGAGQLGSCPDGIAPVPPGNIPFFNPNEDCKINRRINYVAFDPAAVIGTPNNGIPFLKTIQKFGTLEMNYRPVGDLTLTSVTGFYRVDAQASSNGTSAGYAASTLNATNDFDRQELTQELRLNSDFRGPIDFSLGAYYQDGRVRNRPVILGNTALGLQPVVLSGSHRIDIEAYSLFGQLRWKPVDVLEIAGGVRWTDEKRSDRTFNLGTRMDVPKLSSSNFSPEFTITYLPTDDLTLFGSLKQGYKSGSYTITVPVGAVEQALQPSGLPCALGIDARCLGADNSFGDEKVRGGEIGLKSRLLDRSLFINVAGYYYKYKGLQVGANVNTTGIPVVRTINAGGAKIYGIDFDMTYRPPSVDGLSLNAAVNWNHARFTKLDNVPCYGGQTINAGCSLLPNPLTGNNTSQDLTGTRLVRAPDWQMTGGFQYESALSNGWGTTFGLEGNYSSKYPTGLSRRADMMQKGYLMLNANLSVYGPDKRWEVSLISNNLTNKITAGGCTTLNYANGSILGGQVTGGAGVGPAGIDELTCVTRPGRELWLRLTFRPFGGR